MCAPPGTLRVSHSAKRSASHWLIGVHLGPGIFLNGIARKNSSGHVLWQPTMKDRNVTAIAHSLWKLSKKHLAYHRIFVGCTQCGTLTMSVISRKTCAAIYIVSGARPSVPVSMPCRTAAMQTPTVSSPSVPRGWRSMAFCRTLCGMRKVRRSGSTGPDTRGSAAAFQKDSAPSTGINSFLSLPKHKVPERDKHNMQPVQTYTREHSACTRPQ